MPIKPVLLQKYRTLLYRLHSLGLSGARATNATREVEHLQVIPAVLEEIFREKNGVECTYARHPVVGGCGSWDSGSRDRNITALCYPSHFHVRRLGPQGQSDPHHFLALGKVVMCGCD